MNLQRIVLNQTLRNFIAHGRIEIKIEKLPDGLDFVQVKFFLNRKGRDQIIIMSQGELERFSMILGEVAGKLAMFEKIQPPNALISCQDRLKLREFLKKTHPHHPSLTED